MASESRWQAAAGRLQCLRRLGRAHRPREEQGVANITVALGAVLIGLGLYGRFGTGTESITALIPAFMGLPLLLLGVLAHNDRFRKHAMHTAVLIALVGFVGCAVMAAPKVPALLTGGEIKRADGSDATVAVLMQTITGLLCAVFVGLGVNSFISARRRRQAGASNG
jgi:hypothetical protein